MSKLRCLLMALVIVFLLSPMAWAQENSTASIQVDGLSCPFCTYGLEKQLKKVAGITSVSIDLKAGKAIISMSKHVDDRVLRQAVKKAGFTARAISRP